MMIGINMDYLINKLKNFANQKYIDYYSISDFLVNYNHNKERCKIKAGGESESRKTLKWIRILSTWFSFIGFLFIETIPFGSDENSININ